MGCNRYAINCTYLNCTVLYHLRYEYTHEIITVINCHATPFTKKALHQGFNSGAVSVCRVTWPWSESMLEYFHSSQKKPQPHEQPLSFPANCRGPRQLWISLPLPVLWTFCINGIKQYVVLCDWALTLHDVFRLILVASIHTLWLTTRETVRTFSKAAASLCIPRSSTRGFSFLYTLLHTVICFVLFFFNHYSLPSECELIFHVLWFWFAFLW